MKVKLIDAGSCPLSTVDRIEIQFVAESQSDQEVLNLWAKFHEKAFPNPGYAITANRTLNGPVSLAIFKAHQER